MRGCEEIPSRRRGGPRIPSQPPRHRAVAALAFAFAACLSRPALVPHTFSLDAPAPTGAPPRAPAAVVALRRVEVATELGEPGLLYRLSGHRLERDPYATLAGRPADVLTQAIRAYLQGAGVAREVVEPGSGIRADWLIDVYASDLAGDFTRADAPAGVLVLQFRVQRAADGSAPLLDKTYSSRRAIPRRTAGAVVAAWNDGLAEIMAAFEHDVGDALASASATNR